MTDTGKDKKDNGVFSSSQNGNSSILEQKISHLFAKPHSIEDQIDAFRSGFIRNYELAPESIKDLDKIIQERILAEQGRFFPGGKIDAYLAEQACAIGLKHDNIGDTAELSIPENSVPARYAGIVTFGDLLAKYDELFDSKAAVDQNIADAGKAFADLNNRMIKLEAEWGHDRKLLEEYQENDSDTIHASLRKIIGLKAEQNALLEQKVKAFEDKSDACKACMPMLQSKLTEEELDHLIDLDDRNKLLEKNYADAQAKIAELESKPAAQSAAPDANAGVDIPHLLEIEKNYADILEKYDAAQAELQELKSRPEPKPAPVDNTALEEAKKLAQNRLDALNKKQKELAGVVKSRKSLETSLANAENSLASTQSAFENKSKEYQTLFEQHNAVKTSYTNLENSLSEAREELVQAKKQLAEAEKRQEQNSSQEMDGIIYAADEKDPSLVHFNVTDAADEVKQLKESLAEKEKRIHLLEARLKKADKGGKTSKAHFELAEKYAQLEKAHDEFGQKMGQDLLTWAVAACAGNYFMSPEQQTKLAQYFEKEMRPNLAVYLNDKTEIDVDKVSAAVKAGAGLSDADAKQLDKHEVKKELDAKKAELENTKKKLAAKKGSSGKEIELKKQILFWFADSLSDMYGLSAPQSSKLGKYLEQEIYPKINDYFKKDGVTIDDAKAELAVRKGAGLPDDFDPLKVRTKNDAERELSLKQLELDNAYARIKELENAKTPAPYVGEPDLAALDKAIEARIKNAAADKQAELDKAHARIKALENCSKDVPADLKALENAIDKSTASEKKHLQELVNKLAEKVNADDENRHALMYILDKADINPYKKVKIYKEYIAQEDKREAPDNYLAGAVCNNLAALCSEWKRKDLMKNCSLAKKYIRKAIKFAHADIEEISSEEAKIKPGEIDAYERKLHAALGRLEKYESNLKTCLSNIDELLNDNIESD